MCASSNWSVSSGGKQRRLALVIGNSRYQSGSSLRNPVNDADDMTSALKSIGFEVDKGLDLKSTEMEYYVENFVRKIQKYDLILFHFSGHGAQSEDQNYLLPVDDHALSTTNIKRHALNAQSVLKRLTDRKPYVSIFFLDCCRNYLLRNPNSNLLRGPAAGEVLTRGLTEMYATEDSFIALSCAPGETASDGSERNGLFTKHLLQHITRPNEDIDQIMRDVSYGVQQESNRRQVPYRNSSLTKKNVFLSTTDDHATQFAPTNETSGTLKDGKFMNKKADPTTAHKPQKFPSNLSHQVVTPTQVESSWSSGFTKTEEHSFHVSVSGYDSNSGAYDYEYHGQSEGDRNDPFIKRLEKRFGMDIDGDGKIG